MPNKRQRNAYAGHLFNSNVPPWDNPMVVAVDDEAEQNEGGFARCESNSQAVIHTNESS